jgi:hypothetical protein
MRARTVERNALLVVAAVLAVATVVVWALGGSL